MISPDSLLLLATARGYGSVLEGKGGKPTYTADDVAWALSGLPAKYADAFVFRICGDDSVKRRLWSYVILEAVDLALAEHWPERINGQKYLEKLTRMVLDEERWKAHEKKDFVRAIYMDMPEDIWIKRLNKPYAQLQSATMESWVGSAWRHIRNKING